MFYFIIILYFLFIVLCFNYIRRLQSVFSELNVTIKMSRALEKTRRCKVLLP